MTSGQFGIWSHQVLVLSRTRFWYFQGNQSHLLLESHTCDFQKWMRLTRSCATDSGEPSVPARREKGTSLRVKNHIVIGTGVPGEFCASERHKRLA
jgi:hypothetical protein